MVTVMLYVVMFCKPEQVPSNTLFTIVVITMVIGLLVGLYIMFRAEFTSLYSIIVPTYIILLTEVSFGGSLVAFAVQLSGRYGLRWFAFNTNFTCVVVTLLISILMEAKKLKLLMEESHWREEIGKYLDYSKRLVSPTLTTRAAMPTSINAICMAAAIGVNIPLLFQIYGGGRNNAIFLAVPLMTVTFTYINLKIFGPGLTRIFLLRKIEKEQGYRFQNADYEKIQELRRGFFLSRWLMKDYRPPINTTPNAKSNKQSTKKQKHSDQG
jgi:hypothetical protein